MRRTLIVSFVLLASIAQTRPATQPTSDRTKLPEYLQKYLAFRDSEYESELKQVQSQIQIESRGLASTRSPSLQVDPMVRRQMLSDAQKKITQLGQQLAALRKSGPGQFVPTLSGIAVGAGGNLRFPVRIIQRQGESAAIIAIGNTDAVISGINLKDHPDGDTISLTTPIICTGTSTYTTVTGAARTVLAITPFNPADYANY